MVLLEARRAEHRDAGPDEVQRAEAADELGEDPERHPELGTPRLGALEEARDLDGTGCPAPFVCHGWMIPRTWNRSTACDTQQWPCHADFHAKRRGFTRLTTAGGRWREA